MGGRLQNVESRQNYLPPGEGTMASSQKEQDGSKVPHNKTSSGLQLSFTKTNIVSVPMVEFGDLSHFVEFKFDVLPALHVETITEKLSTIQLLVLLFCWAKANIKLHPVGIIQVLVMNMRPRLILHVVILRFLVQEKIPQQF